MKKFLNIFFIFIISFNSFAADQTSLQQLKEQTAQVVQLFNEFITTVRKLTQPYGSFVKANISAETVRQAMPSKSLATPWGSTIAITEVQDNSLKIAIKNVPSLLLCYSLKSAIQDLNLELNHVPACAQTGPADIVFTYHLTTVLDEQRQLSDIIKGITAIASILATSHGDSYSRGNLSTNIVKHMLANLWKFPKIINFEISKVTDSSYQVTIKDIKQASCIMLKDKLAKDPNYDMAKTKCDSEHSEINYIYINRE